MSSVAQISKNYLPINDDQALLYVSNFTCNQSALNEGHARLIEETRPSFSCSCWTWLFSSCSKYEQTLRIIFLETSEFYKELARRLAELYGKNDAAPLCATLDSTDEHRSSLERNEIDKLINRIEENSQIVIKSLTKNFSDIEARNIFNPLKQIISFIKRIGDDFNNLSNLSKINYLYKVIDCGSELEINGIWIEIQKELEATDVSDRSSNTPPQQTSFLKIVTMGRSNIVMSGGPQVCVTQEIQSNTQSSSFSTLKIENKKENAKGDIVAFSSRFVVDSDVCLKIPVSSFIDVATVSAVV